jgi:peptide/nickel transport system permease protein
MWIRLVLRHVLRLSLVLFIGGFLGAALVRMAPGFGVSEQELDARRSAESITALRQAANQNVFSYYGSYLAGIAKGDLGTSISLQRPVLELLVDRIPVTVRSVSYGLVAGWVLALALAFTCALWQFWPYEVFATVLTGGLLSVPAAAITLVILFLNGPVPLAIALVIFPKVFRYTHSLLRQVYERPHVLMARAKGLSPWRILLVHVVPAAGAELIALIGISVSLALSAAIPIEALCDSPGVGQLAWQAALGRDLPLLVNITLIVAFVTLLSTSLSEMIAVKSRGQA